MTAAAPWSVKGIDPRAREAAKDLARQANMTLGEWLNQLILEDEGSVQPQSAAPRAAQPPSAPTLSSLPASVPPRSVAGEPYRQAGERILAPQHPADEVGKVAQALERLSARIEASEKRSQPPASASGERELNAIAARFEGAVQDLSGEHAKLSERLGRIEAEAVGPRSAAAMKSLEGALGRVAERLYEGEGRLDGRFSAIERRLTQAEEAAPTEILRDLSTSMLALDARLRGLEVGAATALDDQMALIDQRLTEGLQAARSETAARVETIDRRTAEAIDRMGLQVAGVTHNLSGRLEAVEQHGLQAVERVGGEVARLAGAVEQRLGRTDAVQAQALEKLGGEIARITERLAERIAAAERRSALAIDDVGEQMARVTDRLAQRHDRTSEEIAERIRASEERTARLLEEARERIGASLIRARGDALATEPEPEVKHETPAQLAETPTEAPSWALDSPFGEGSTLDLGDLAFSDDALDENVVAAVPPEVQAAPADPAVELELDADLPIDDFPATEPVPAFLSDDFAAYDVDPVDDSSLVSAPGPLDGEAISPDLFAAEMFDPSQPATTRQVIERARAAARAAAETGPRRKSGSLLSGFGRKDSKARSSLFSSAAVLAVVALSAGGIGLASAAIWQMGHQSNALEPTDGGLAVTPVTTTDGEASRAAIAISSSAETSPATAANPAAPAAPASTPAKGLAGGQLATAPKTPVTPLARATSAASGGVNLDALYRDGARRIEAKDNSGLDVLQRAANLGYAPAQFYLSKLYENGEAGLKKDLAQARLWTQRAADAGDAKGMYNLGLDYYEGVGGTKDYAQAAAWFSKAANAGLPDSQYNLALLYERGVGLTQNAAEAYRWYLIASQSGDEASKAEARGAAARVKLQLTADAAAIAERSAAAFRASGATATAAATPSNDIATVQKALNRLGYYNGPQDGVLSATLTAAITGYRQDQGLSGAGKVDANLVNRLQVFAR